MVCKKCGRSFNGEISTCPFCGVGQENQINIKKLDNELEKLKIEDNTSNFNSEKINNKTIIDIDDIIYDLEELKIKDEDKNDEIIPHVEPVSDEELIELISDIKENKELFIPDKSQYQYIKKKCDETDIETIDIETSENNTNYIGINDLIKKQRLYYQDEIKNDKPINIELPSVLNINSNNNENTKTYKKQAIICLIILLFVSVIAGIFIYKFMFSPKAIFLKQINEQYTKIEDMINKNTSKFSELISNDNISISSVSTISTINNNNTSNKEIVNIKYIENKKNKSQYYEYTNLNSDKTIFKKMFIKDNKLYLNKENVSNDYYVTNAKYVSLLNNIDKNDVTYLFNKLIDNIKDNLKDSNFKVKSYKEDGKKYKETALIINQELYNKIYTTYLKEIKKDNKALEIIQDNYQYSSVELVTEINNRIKELETNTIYKDIITYKVYTNEDNKIIKHIINYNNIDIVILNNNKEIELEVSKDNQEVLFLKIKNINEITNRYNITMKHDNYTLLGDYYEEDNKVIFNYQKNYNETFKKQEIVNLVLIKGELESKRYSNNISIAYQKTENGNVINKSIETSNVLEVNTEIPQLNASNNIQIMDENLRNELKKKFSIFIK